MKFSFPILIAAALGAPIGSAHADERPGEFEQIQWVHNPAEAGFDFSWTGKEDRYYFVEQSQLLVAGSWSFFPFAVKGEGDFTGLFLSQSADKFFFRLTYTDNPFEDFLLEDFDGDGYSNRDELDMGTDPFDATDADNNGIPDDIDAFWAAVPDAWKLSIVNDVNADYYDPDGMITSIADISPGGDYNGNGRSNIREYLDGTDPTDFFSGQTPVLSVFVGDGQTSGPNQFVKNRIYVKVRSGAGVAYLGAPVKYTSDGHQGLSATRDESQVQSELIVRTDTYGAPVEYYTPATTGTSQFTATLPTGQSISITVHVVDSVSAAKPPMSNFVKTENEDGTYTYTWNSHTDEGDTFYLERQAVDGTWFTVFEATYGSAELPYISSETSYSLTLDENFQVVE